MKVEHLCLLLILFIALSTAQRGGGSGSKSSSSSSSSHSSYRSSSVYYGSSSHTPKNCTTVNGTTTCIYEESEMSLSTALIIIAVVIVILIAAGYSSAQAQKERKSKILAEFANYQINLEANMCTLDDQQRSNAITWFMEKKWTMVINLKNNNEKFFCQVKAADLKKRTEFIYDIEMTGSDEVGKSKFTGIVTFQRDFIGLKFEKTYDNRKDAGQTGSFDLLFYEGVQQGEVFNGSWSYKGYEMSDQYSGTWMMTSAF